VNHLSSIPDSFKLYAVCAACERMEEVDRLAVIEKSGDMTVKYFRTKVRCSECGKRTEDIRIVYVGKTGFGYRDH
jgi:hypothetical protein